MEKYIKEEDLPARDYLGAGYISNLNALQVVNTKNHLKLNFYNRFKKYLKLRTGETENAVVYRWLKENFLQTKVVWYASAMKTITTTLCGLTPSSAYSWGARGIFHLEVPLKLMKPVKRALSSL